MKKIKEKILDYKNKLILKEGVPNLKKYKLAKIVRRDNSPFFNSLMRVGSTLKNSELSFDSRMFLHIVLDGDIYYCEKDLRRLEKIILEKERKDNKFLNKYFKKVIDDCSDYLKWSKKENDFSDPEKTFEEFVKRSLKLMSHLWPCAAPEAWILNKIETELSRHIDPKNNFSEFKKTLVILTSPTEFSNTNLKKKEIFEGADLKEVYKKYVWESDQGFTLNYESFSNFKKNLEKIKNPRKELKKMISELEELKQAQKNIVKKYNLNDYFVNLCECARLLPHIRLIRRDCIIEAGYNLKNFFSKLKKILPLSDITLAYYWEILDLLKDKKISLKKIEKRKEAYGFIVANRNFYDYDAKNARKIRDEIESKIDLGGEIKGQIACMGNARGIARVLKSAREISRVQRGNILVTSMTTPDYVPAMEKAIAFVTDEGGLSCHVAIIAREMKKPCIIGTKNATKILKDGDLVEVDADRGVVKIIKKQNEK